MDTHDPAVVYATRKAERQAALAAAEGRYTWVANARVLVFLVALAACWWGLLQGALLLWGTLPTLLFVALLVWHERVHRARSALQRAIAHYARGQARLMGTWVGTGPTGEGYVPAAHPYAYDVDAFGAGSLFQLLSDARTHGGENTLARWLLAPATPAEIRARQEAVREQAPDVDLRERLALHAGDAAALDVNVLRAWAALPPRLQSTTWRFVARGLALCALVSAIAWGIFDQPSFPLLGCALLVVIVDRILARQSAAVCDAVTAALHELRALHHVLSCFAGKTATAPWLSARYARFAGAKAALARLVQLLDWLESRRNQLFAPIAFFLLWAPNFAFLLEDWRRKHGAFVLAWLDVAGELQALSAFAQQSFEHPHDCFPEIVPGSVLVAEAIRHPLMREHKCVANDVHIEAPLQLLLVSGSNMSGKSTLMRTLGLNTVLALAGAPVRARAMRVSPMQVAATLRVQDSLHEGASRFFAEIARLKVVADCAQQGPTFFLLDEILSGTNSHDRRIGTEAVVRVLLAKGGIGLVSTHDLALTEIATDLDTRAKNVHFEDQMAGTSLAFDYTMRPGVVQKSNAIALMRAVGLDV